MYSHKQAIKETSLRHGEESNGQSEYNRECVRGGRGEHASRAGTERERVRGWHTRYLLQTGSHGLDLDLVLFFSLVSLETVRNLANYSHIPKPDE